jgi:C4-type Zn-finger protein
MKVRYTCPYCKETNELTNFWKWFTTPHFGTRKLIKCTRCQATSYMKRQDGRKILDWPTEKR